MTDRDLIQIKEIIREVIREEMTPGGEWFTLSEFMNLVDKKRVTIWSWEKKGLVETKLIGTVKYYRAKLT